MIKDETRVPEFLKMLDELTSTHLEIGIFGDGKGGEEHEESDGISVLEIANIHEFGAPKVGIPERSFVRSGYDSNKDNIISQIEPKLIDVIKLKTEPSIFVETAGHVITGMMQEFITDLSSPPLKPASIKARRYGGSNPLVDGGQLRSSITFQAKKA